MRKKISRSKNPYWEVYSEMQNRLLKANEKLAKDLSRKKINWEKVHEDARNLMLLLGECNYIKEECRQAQKKGKLS